MTRAIQPPLPPRWAWHVATLVGLGVAAIFAWSRLSDAIDNSVNLAAVTTSLADSAQVGGRGLQQPRRIVLAGEAFPTEAAAYWTGSHFVAQLLPRSMPTFRTMPLQRQGAWLDSLFRGRADAAWIIQPDGQLVTVTFSKSGATR